MREQYLGRRDHTTAAYYVGDAEAVLGKRIAKSPLDEAIAKLESILKLSDVNWDTV